MENCVYDPEGQLLTATFADYTMPRAEDMPELLTSLTKQNTLHNQSTWR